MPLSARRPRLPSRDELDDDRVVVGVAAGVLWSAGALVGAIASVLAGPDSAHAGLRWGIFAFALVYGFASLSGAIDFRRLTMGHQFAIGVAAMPLLGLGIWASGGSGSYIMPLLLPVLVHEAYFFAWRRAIVLNGLVVLVHASPMLYEGWPTGSFAGRQLTFAVAAVLTTVTLRALKGRLVAAERRQRRMALSDPLTGLANRRAFDEALAHAATAAGDARRGRREDDGADRFAVVLFDLDGFKEVNDTLGHMAGDAMLRTVAAHCAAVVRPDDTLARIGGDEFAVVAPRAGGAGAQRLAADLDAAVEAAGIVATVAWAVHPVDGATGEELLQEADRRLYAGKRPAPYDPVAWQS